MEYERRSATPRIVPRLVEDCIVYMRAHGLHTEGIFRLPGGAGTVRRLKQEYNSAQPNNLDENGADIHSVASLLKLYLRELPEPVIPFKYYEDFTTMGLKIQWQPDVALGQLHDKLCQLPKDNYNCLKYICSFLHDVCANSEFNRMTDANLAMMFGPNLLRTDDENPILMLSTADLNTMTVRSLIANFEQIFQREYDADEVPQRRGGLPDINQTDFDLLCDSPSHSGLPSPILPRRPGLEDDFSRKSSNSSLNEDESSRDDPLEEDHPPINFRVNSVTRDSRKRLKRFNILSSPTRPDIGKAKPDVDQSAVFSETSDGDSNVVGDSVVQPEASPKRKPPVPVRSSSVRKHDKPPLKETRVAPLAVEEEVISPIEETGPAVVRPKPIPRQRSTTKKVPTPERVEAPEDIYDVLPPRNYDSAALPPSRRSLNKAPTPDRATSEDDLDDSPPPRNSASSTVSSTGFSPTVPRHSASSTVSSSGVSPADVSLDDIDAAPLTNHVGDRKSSDDASELDRLRSEVAKLTKTQSNLSRIYQRQMDAELKSMEERYEKKLDVLNDKLKHEKQATNLAVERLTQVQQELEKYQIKYGPLIADSDEG